MIEKNIQFREKREIGEIITDSFLFLKQEIKPLSNLVLVYVLPFILLYAVVQVFVQQKLIGTVAFGDPESMIGNLLPIYKNLFITVLFNVFVQSLLIGTIYSYIEVYVNKGKNNFTLSEITPLLFSNSLLALGANLILTIIVTIGTIMCIIPGIYFGNTLSLTLIIFIFEKKGLNGALTKSWKLVNAQWWNTFLLNVLAIILIWIVGFIISMPTTIAGLTTNILNTGQEQATELPNWYWVLNGFNALVSSLLYIIPYTFLAFQYFNLDEQIKGQENPPMSIE